MTPVEAPADARDVLVHGPDLARLLTEYGRPGLPVASVLDWLSEAAEALTALHRDGGVHGDVTPANLVLDESGRIVLVDPRRNGKPASMAGFQPPEADGGTSADRAADVYGLAATAVALLSGRAPTPWRRNGVAQHLDRFEAVLRDGLADELERRPATPRELVEQLRAEWNRAAPTGPGTILVADWADETETRRVDVQLAVDRAVEEHGGHRRSAEPGAPTVALFYDATSAVRAGVAVQRSLRRSPAPPRVGLASGELADASDGDPLTEQARLLVARADPGQVLLAESTADQVRTRLSAEMRLVEVEHDADTGAGVVAVATVGVSSPPDPSRNPYPGLAAFGQNDSDLFVGREEAVEQCLRLLVSERFVAIVGASGSGKSSLIHAGLLPWLADAVQVRPGEQPGQALANAGAADRPDAILVVDQLEEVVTLCRNPEEQAAFVDAILDHPGGLAVALQADRYGEFAQFSEFAQLLSSCQVLLGPLDDDEVSRVVNEPAERCGLTVETDLDEIVATDLPRVPGALPLLAHALRETWRRRDGSMLTRAAYREAGGVRSAIAVTGERTYGAFGEAEQAVMRRLLLRMVEVRSDGDVRRWVTDSDVAQVDRTRGPAILSTLAATGLVVTDGGRSTVAHDAVLTAWPRLAEWIAAERATSLVERRRSDHRGHRALLGFLALATSLVALTALVIAFVAVSERTTATQQRDAAQSAALLADAQAAAVDQPDAAMLLAVEARADDSNEASTGAVVDALLARPSVRSFLQGAPSAVEAIAVGGTTVVGASGNAVSLWTHGGWQHSGSYRLGESTIADLELSADGQTLLAAIPDDHALAAVETKTGQPMADPVDYGSMSPIGVVSAGELVLVLVDDLVGSATAFRVEQRDLRTLDPAGPSFVPPEGRLEHIAVAEDGSQAAITTSDGTVWLANLETGAVALGASAPVSEDDVGIEDLAWHADLLVAGRADGDVDAWRVDAGGTLVTMGRFNAGGPVDAVAAGCDGSCLAAGTADGRIISWRIGSEQIPLDVQRAHDGRVNDLEFSTDDAVLISAGSDHVTAVHALDGSLTIAPSALSGGAPARGAYDTGDTIFSGTDDAERGRIVRRLNTNQEMWRTEVTGAVTWLAATNRRVVALVDPAGEPMRFVVLDASTGEILLDELVQGTRVTGAMSPDGSTVVLASRDSFGSSMFLVDLGILSISEPVRVEERVTAVSVSPDGSRVVTGHATGDVAVRRLDTFTPEGRSRSRFDDSIAAVAFTPDGETVIAGGLAGVVHLLDASSLEPRFSPLEGHRRGITGAAANEHVALTASIDGTVRMWDVTTGVAIGGPIPTGGTTSPSIALRHDGERALLQSDRGLLELILVPDEWVRLACYTAGRELTEDERTNHGLTESASACAG